jgi:tripartite-type tricarboxylate transporter receptor subunit TctC
MKLPRRQVLHLAAGAAALAAVSRIARAQTYPTRPVRIVCGYPPGGVVDIYARLISQWLSERLGQQFIVENKPGAGGTIAAETVVRAAPDGYTLLLATSGDAWNTTLYDNLKFHFARDIAAVAPMSRGPGVVHPSVPSKSVPELIAFANSNPGKVNVASAGIGSASHMYWELFRSVTGVNMLHVPYRGGGPAITDLLGGQVHAYFGTGCVNDRVCQDGEASAAGCDHRNPRGRFARRSGNRRIPANLRGEHLCRDCRAAQHACRHCRQAEPGDQSCAYRPENEAEDRRTCRHAPFVVGCRLRQAHC